MTSTAFDEGLPRRNDRGELLPYRCKHHQDRVAVEPISSRLCAQCMESARNAYADVMIKRDKARGPQGYFEMFGGRSGISDHAYLNPNAIAERARNYNDGGKE